MKRGIQGQCIWIMGLGLWTGVAFAQVDEAVHVDESLLASAQSLALSEDEVGASDCTLSSSPNSLAEIHSVSEGKRCLKDIVRKITRVYAKRNPSLYPQPDKDSAHWLSEFRSAKKLSTEQRARFVKDLETALTPAEKSFLVMTMSAYGQAWAMADQGNCIDSELSNPANAVSREKCLNDASSLQAMRNHLSAYVKGDVKLDGNAIFTKVVDGRGSYFHSEMLKMPEMIRGMALAVETSDHALGRDRRSLGFERAIKAYMGVTREAQQVVLANNALSEEAFYSSTQQTASVVHGANLTESSVHHTLAGRVANVVTAPIVWPIKNLILKPVKAGFDHVWPQNEHFLSSDETKQEAGQRIVNRMIDARKKLRDYMGDARWSRIEYACRTGRSLSGDDYNTILSTLRSSKALSTKREAELGGFSESDVMALTATAASEAGSSASMRSSERADHTWENPKIRAEMMATMVVLKNRARNDYKGFSPPKIITVALAEEGNAFEGWKPNVHTACLIAGPLMERQGRGPLSGGDDDLTLWRSVRSFLDLVDPATMISSDTSQTNYKFGKSTYYFAVGYDPYLHKKRVYPQILLADQERAIDVNFHIFANKK